MRRTKAVDTRTHAVSPVSIFGACVAPSVGKAAGASPSRPLCRLTTGACICPPAGWVAPSVVEAAADGTMSPSSANTTFTAVNKKPNNIRQTNNRFIKTSFRRMTKGAYNRHRLLTPSSKNLKKQKGVQTLIGSEHPCFAAFSLL